MTLIDSLAIYGAGMTTLLYYLLYFRKYLITGRIEPVFKGLSIEFDILGPHLTLNCSFRALKKDVYVKNVEVEILNEKTKENHKFQWLAFKDPKMVMLGSVLSLTVELTFPFSVSTSSPYKTSIIFHDSDTFVEIEKILTEVRKHLQNDLISGKAFTPEFTLGFPKTPEFGKWKQELGDVFYWKKGSYIMIITGEDDKGEVFKKNFKFTLNEENCESLRSNTILIIFSFIAPRNLPSYNIVFPKITEV